MAATVPTSDLCFEEPKGLAVSHADTTTALRKCKNWTDASIRNLEAWDTADPAGKVARIEAMYHLTRALDWIDEVRYIHANPMEDIEMEDWE